VARRKECSEGAIEECHEALDSRVRAYLLGPTLALQRVFVDLVMRSCEADAKEYYTDRKFRGRLWSLQ
jgi:hypothetical protein